MHKALDYNKSLRTFSLQRQPPKSQPFVFTFPRSFIEGPMGSCNYKQPFQKTTHVGALDHLIVPSKVTFKFNLRSAPTACISFNKCDYWCLKKALGHHMSQYIVSRSYCAPHQGSSDAGPCPGACLGAMPPRLAISIVEYTKEQ